MELRDLHDAERPAAARLLARAMCDDPMHRVVFGPDPAQRLQRLHRFFTALLPQMVQAPLAAWDAGRLVGVLGRFAPGACRLPPQRQLRIARGLLPLPLRELWRLWCWTEASAARDLPEPHWHVGPVAVATDRQGQGIGGQLLREFCEWLDRQGEVAFLETDKTDSVRFYARCGFKVIAQAEVLGTPNWWMRRPPEAR